MLILDEPTSGLDPMVRREFLESMVDVAAQGRTVILASHQIAEVERVADYVAILRQGKLVLLEQLDALKDRVCELTVTLRNGVPDLPSVPGTVLHRELKGRQWRLLVRNMDESQFDGFPHCGKHPQCRSASAVAGRDLCRLHERRAGARSADRGARLVIGLWSGRASETSKRASSIN